MKNQSLRGWLAVGIRSGRTVHLSRVVPGDRRMGPRGLLLRALCRHHATKMYVDMKSGGSRHVGYVCGGDWWNIYEVHEWKGTGR
jgi:hypothetical protein